MRKEVRFGVVMYGGVSLAIYINGIAQELLHMMRSTAPVVEGETGVRPQNARELQGTEVIYRKISYLLGGENRRLGDAEADLERDTHPPTAFVVDIISGTSAGGINGIFLGKALANGQDIGSLSKLWVDEGDISKLINDRRSIESPLSLQSPPVSLLNSQRMYYKLLDAFTTMDATGDGEKPSPFVNELDLYITATDIRGVTVPLRLADNVVHERRHRNVFHFKYAKGDRLNNGRNDFRSANNPFLAYAARCTSAFPFAFEPMRLCDIDDVLGGMKAYCHDRDSRSASARWQPFFKSYLKAETFPLRPFGDGGYLDNKPFTYATEALLRRTADVPVDRKLIYIEPSPEHPERDRENLDTPDVVENVAAALLTLPRSESIREDLQRVLERNRLIQRVNRILSGIERDFERSSMRTPVVPLSPVLSDEEWSKLDLADMVRRKSRGYLGYHRLDIAHVTDLMAALVARLANVDEESDYLVSIRGLIRAWRDGRYTEYRLREDGSKDRRPTMNRFLYQFNYQYALRRLTFLRAKLDQLHRLDNDALDVFRFYAADDLPRDFVDVVNESPASPRRDELRRAVRAELRQIKSEINEVYVELRSRGRLLQSRAKPKPQDGRQAGARQAVNPLLRCFEERHLNEFNLSAAGLLTVLKRVLGENQSAQETDAGSCARLLAEEECVERAKAELSANADLRNWVNHFAKKLVPAVWQT
ncbi:MAG: patatin-like phospholipase family protein [Acidobacteria bacterium]|nr:patatin-like phospholipase family protein [Acidobacteriota bacterium]